jgi:hypothetical protein
MSLESTSRSAAPVAGAQWLQQAVWQAGGYPDVRHDVQTVAALEVTEVGAALQPEAPEEAGVRMRDVASRLVTAAAATVGVAAFELRYRVTPRPSGQAEVRLFLLAKAYGHDPASVTAVEAALIAAGTCLPPNFAVRPAVAVDEVLDVPADFDVVEVQRSEQVTYPQWNFIPSQYYYHLDRVSGDGSGWLSFVHSLARSPRPLVVSFLFKPTSLDAAERDTLGGMLSELAIYANDRTDYNVLGMQEFYPGDANARVAFDAWDERLALVAQRPLLCRIAVAGSDDIAATYGAHLVAALQSSRQSPGNSLEVIGWDILGAEGSAALRGSMRCMEIWPSDALTMWQYADAPLQLRRMQYLYGIEEAGSIALLPVPDEHGVPGFVRARRQQQRRVMRYAGTAPAASVRLGHFVHYGDAGEPADLPLAALNRHTLVVGVPGYGKTTSVMTILTQLWTQHRVPWAVIEPTRPEYRLLAAVDGLEELQVLTLGRDDIAPLRLNPLAPPAGVRCATHISSLVNLFKLAMPLLPPLPELLSTALQRTYLISGWDFDSRLEDGLPVPTMRDLATAFNEEFHEAGYNGEALNVCAAFGVRLRGLLSGAIGQILDTTESTDVAALLRAPVVFELRDIEDPEDKALAGALLLQHIRASAAVRGSGEGQLRHVTVLEEAHRMLPAEAGGSAETGQQTRTRAAEEFVNAIAELRSSGEGFVICSQRPSRLAKAAIGNTDTRIVHHLTDADDRDMMTRDVAGNEADQEDAARLRVGEALVRWFGLDHPEVARVDPADGVDTAHIPTDDAVALRMQAHAAQTRALLPYVLCSPTVCTSGCTSTVRRAGRALELRTRPSLRSRIAGEPDMAFGRYTDLVAGAYAAKHADGPAVTYCAVVHSLVEGSGDGSLLGLSEQEREARRSQLQRNVEAAHERA